MLNYNTAMNSPNIGKRCVAIDEEYQRMKKSNVFTLFTRVKKKDVNGQLILDTTWAMKRKANGTQRARMVANGFQQEAGNHYDPYNFSSPAANEVTYRCVLVFMIIFDLVGNVIDISGAFLLGEFDATEKIYISVPIDFEKYYDTNDVLLLNRTLYGLKQSAKPFYRQLILYRARA